VLLEDEKWSGISSIYSVKTKSLLIKEVLLLAKEKINQSNDQTTQGHHKKTLKDVKQKNPLNWGVLDLVESVQQKEVRED